MSSHLAASRQGRPAPRRGSRIAPEAKRPRTLAAGTKASLRMQQGAAALATASGQRVPCSPPPLTVPENSWRGSTMNNIFGETNFSFVQRKVFVRSVRGMAWSRRKWRYPCLSVWLFVAALDAPLALPGTKPTRGPVAPGRAPGNDRAGARRRTRGARCLRGCCCTVDDTWRATASATSTDQAGMHAAQTLGGVGGNRGHALRGGGGGQGSVLEQSKET